MTEQENNDRTKLLLKDESRSRYVLWAAGGVLAALVAGAWYWYQGTQNTNAVKYVTEAVERGDVHVSVSADGTVQPADEIAAAIVWMLSDAASYTTGAVLQVTGGR